MTIRFSEQYDIENTTRILVRAKHLKTGETFLKTFYVASHQKAIWLVDEWNYVPAANEKHWDYTLLEVE